MGTGVVCAVSEIEKPTAFEVKVGNLYKHCYFTHMPKINPFQNLSAEGSSRFLTMGQVGRESCLTARRMYLSQKSTLWLHDVTGYFLYSVKVKPVTLRSLSKLLKCL